MRWSRAAVMSGVVASCLLACQLLASVDDEDGVTRPTADAGPDVAPDANDPCVKHHPPPRPSPGVAAGGGSLDDMVFAFRSFRVRPLGPYLGYDIDEHCTGDPTSTTSKSPCQKDPAEDASDGDGGVDNALGRVIDRVAPAETDQAGDSLTKTVNKGNFTLLLQVWDYNGQPNDDQVNAALITAPRLARNVCDGGLVEAGEGPRWEAGCDSWDTSSAAFTIVGRATNNVLRGYVADDVLVVTRPDEPKEIKFALGRSSLLVREPVVTARIDRSDGGLRLSDGLIVGRVAASTFLTFFFRLEIDGDKALCELVGAPDQVTTLRDGLCALRDVPQSSKDDRTGAAACDALSFVLGFDAERAGLTDAGSESPLACPDLDASCP